MQIINTTGIETDIDRQKAILAYNWTSFNPEKRGEAVLVGYVQTLTALAEHITKEATDERQQAIAQEVFDRLRAKYRQRTLDWLSAHSRCASSAITGGSGFNVRRAEKANNAEHNKMGELIALEKAMFVYASKSLANVIPKEEKQADDLAAVKARLANAEKMQEFMKQANALQRKGDQEGVKSLFDNATDYNRFMRPNYIGQVGFERFQLTNNLARIKSMRERIAILETKATQTGTTEQDLNGLKIVRNLDADRLQLIFDGKPSEEERTFLKRHGFKWSPRFTAWQRQLTNNAEWTLKNYVLSNPLFVQYQTKEAA